MNEQQPMTFRRPVDDPGLSRRRLGAALLAGALAAQRPSSALAGTTAPPAVPAAQHDVLRRGINITNWFRFPASQEPAWLRRYMPDEAMAELRAAGFTFVRFCIQPQLLLQPDGSLEPTRLAILLDGVERFQRAGLGVIVDAHPESWYPEQHPEHRVALLRFWQAMAPRLQRFDPRLTVVEILNEPIFQDHAAWATLQREALAVVRAALPRHTVILTGADWGSLEGLLQLRPVEDARVIYSVHDYNPSTLTILAWWEREVDAQALARLPFPVTDAAACRAAVSSSRHAQTRALGEAYCEMGWNAERLHARLARAAAWGREHRVPVMMLEFGAHAHLPPATRLAYLAAYRAAAEREGMSWALWGYGDILGFPARDGMRPASLDQGVLRALGLRA